VNDGPSRGALALSGDALTHGPFPIPLPQGWSPRFDPEEALQRVNSLVPIISIRLVARGWGGAFSFFFFSDVEVKEKFHFFTFPRPQVRL